MSKKGNFKNNNKKISKVKKNTYSNNVSLVKQEPKKKEEKKVVASVSNDQDQTPEKLQAKYIMILSFAFLGFLFAFLANFGFFDLQKALLAGFWGIAGGAGFAYLPYWLASREN